MQIPLYASEPADVAQAAAARLARCDVPHTVGPAAVPTPEQWGAGVGAHDVRVEHGDLKRARQALADFSPEPVAGRAAPGGATVLRIARRFPYWTDQLAAAADGGVVVVRTVPVVDEALRVAAGKGDWGALQTLVDSAGTTLNRFRRVTDLAPELVATQAHAVAGVPSLELVLRPPAGTAALLTSAWRRGPWNATRAAVAWRMCRDASLAAARDTLPLGALRPGGLLAYADGRLLHMDLGLDALLDAAGHTRRRRRFGPLGAPERTGDLVGSAALAANLYESAAIFRALLAGGPGKPLPPAHAGLERFFQVTLADDPQARCLSRDELDGLLGT